MDDHKNLQEKTIISVFMQSEMPLTIQLTIQVRIHQLNSHNWQFYHCVLAAQ